MVRAAQHGMQPTRFAALSGRLMLALGSLSKAICHLLFT